MFAAEGNYDVVDASNADEGYEAYLKYKPDLCILDISLPGKSGFDLTKRILGQNKSKHALWAAVTLISPP
jgi:DNA-binding response OmpR family regulator